MNRNVIFTRKITYVGAIALLLFPLFRLGQPASPSGGGGWLAGMRKEHGLAQTQIGDIDATSETMKLVTLGMRGVAANVLWNRATEYSKKEDWDNLRVTLNQITTLQPNFIKVWQYQAHNLSYNISVEFDDYRYRYHWVKKGIDFLIEGTHYNTDEPALLRETGWFTSHKIGRSDEKTEFRELFRNDNDYHRQLQSDIAIESRDVLGPDGKPDCWLVGRAWYGMAQDAVSAGRSMRGRSPLIFYSDGPMARIYFSQAIEDEGWFGEQAQTAWQRSLEDWRGFGEREIATTWGHNIRLAAFYDHLRERDDARKQLDDLVPGLREQLKAAKEAALDEEEKAALATPPPNRNERQWLLAGSIPDKVRVSDKDVVENIPANLKNQGSSLSAKLYETQMMLDHCDRYRGIVNYGYWEMRCEAEQTEEAVTARTHVYEALNRLKKTDLVAAREEFERAWDKWAQLFEKFPALMDDVTGEALNESVDKYENLLLQMGMAGLPPDFKLRDLRRIYQRAQGNMPSQESVGSPPNVEVREIPAPGQPPKAGPEKP